MAAGKDRSISPADLDRAIRSVAEHFSTDTVYVVGSQALLVGRNDIARSLRYSREIDAYPGNKDEWEALSGGIEASEAINGLFGEGSQFHETHGFFIDGVDETTAILPPDWRDREVRKTIDGPGGRIITAIAPAPADVVAAKLVRGLARDIEFAARCMGSGLATNSAVKAALQKAVSGDLLTICLARANPGVCGSNAGLTMRKRASPPHRSRPISGRIPIDEDMMPVRAGARRVRRARLNFRRAEPGLYPARPRSALQGAIDLGESRHDLDPRPFRQPSPGIL